MPSSIPARTSAILRTSVLVVASLASIATIGAASPSWDIYSTEKSSDRPTVVLSSTSTSWSDMFRVHGTGARKFTLEMYVGVEASTMTPGNAAIPLRVRIVPSTPNVPMQETTFATYGAKQFVQLSTEVECTTTPCDLDATVELALTDPSSLGGRSVSLDYVVIGYARGAGNTPPVDASVRLTRP